MPRTRSLAWSELKIGVLTIAAIGVTAVLIFSLTGMRGFAWQRYSLKTRFPNVAGLAKGSPVRVAGVEVGSVTGIDFAGEEVDVTFNVNKDLRSMITDKSMAALGSVSLLGESAVDITPASSGAPIPDNGYVRSGRARGSIADVSVAATNGIEEIGGLVKDVRDGRGTIGKLVTDDQVYVELRDFVASANTLTRAITQGRGTLGKLVNDPKVAEELTASLQNLEEMTRRIDAGEGSIGKLLKDDAFSQALTAATVNIRDLSGQLKEGQGTAGKLLTDPSLFNRLSDTTSHLNDLVTRLNSGEGTAGQLLKDRQLYENMNKTVKDLDVLLGEIKKDPRKYLNVRISLF